MVVFSLIGLAIFGSYYLLVARPAGAELEEAKTAAMSSISQSLTSAGTDQASAAVSTFTARIQAAGSKADVSTIQAEAMSVYQCELKRKSLLDTVTTAVTGSYHSTADVPALAALATTLRTDINGKMTLSDLQSYELSGTIDNQATTSWRNYLAAVVTGIGKENVLMVRCDSPAWEEFMSKDNALARVASSNWQNLREMHFEGTDLVLVPVTDTFGRTPTIRAGSSVNLYVYDTTTKTMDNLAINATVSSMLYSSSDLATIAWSFADGATVYSYSTDIWEAIKAAAAGDTEAANIGWTDYVNDVLTRAQSAGLGQFTMSAVYMVQVSEERGVKILQYELHESATKDVIMVARV